MGSALPPQDRQGTLGSRAVQTALPARPASRLGLSSRLLLLATSTSVVSTLAFLGYLVLPALSSAYQRSQLTPLYLVGVLGLLAAELCQLLAIFVLIGKWIAGTNKEPKELLVLVLCLIPFVVIVIFLITLFVYLRARRHDSTSQRTRDAAEKVKKRFRGALIAEGSDWSSAQAEAAKAQARSPMRAAVRRVVGPITERSLADSAQALVALTLIALLLSTFATVGVVIPAKGLAPLQALVTRPTATSGQQATPAGQQPAPSPGAVGSLRELSFTADGWPQDLATGPGRAVWFTELDANQIGRIMPDGAVTQFPLPPQYTGAYNITRGPGGNLWFTLGASGPNGPSPDPAAIGRMTPAGAVTTFPLPAAYDCPDGSRYSDVPSQLTFNPDGTLWFIVHRTLAFNCDTIGRMSPSGAITIFTLGYPGADINGITAGPDGAVWFAGEAEDTFAGTSIHRIWRVTPSGQLTVFAVPQGIGGTDSMPQAITTGPDSNLWFTVGGGAGVGAIVRLTPGGEFTPYPLTETYPAGIVAGPDGNLWCTELTSSAILRITRDGAMTPFSLEVGARPHSIIVGPDGYLWYTEKDTAALGGSGTYFIGRIAP